MDSVSLSYCWIFFLNHKICAFGLIDQFYFIFGSMRFLSASP